MHLTVCGVAMPRAETEKTFLSDAKTEKSSRNTKTENNSFPVVKTEKSFPDAKTEKHYFIISRNSPPECKTGKHSSHLERFPAFQ